MDRQKKQGPAEPKTKPVSERKRKANRENAKKSTGPRSWAGKDESKMNAVTHGLLAEHLLITDGELKEDPEAFGRLLAGLREARQPVGALEEALVEEIAGGFWKERRAQRYEAGAIAREAGSRRDREALRSRGRFERALNFGENLEHSVEGIQHLLAALNRAIEEVQRADWSIDSYNMIARHFGHLVSLPPESATRPAHQADRGRPDEFDPEQFVKDLGAQRDRLLERLPEVEVAQKIQGDARIRSYTLPNAADLDLMLRYDTANNRKRYRAMTLLCQIQADRLAAEAAAAVRAKQPAEHIITKRSHRDGRGATAAEHA